MKVIVRTPPNPVKVLQTVLRIEAEGKEEGAA